MSKPLTVLTIFGTRPEVIKVFPVLRKLEQDRDFISITVSTSQHREMIEDLFDLFSINPDYDLGVIRHNQSLSDISTRALSGLNPLFIKHKPHIVLVQGDTTTAFIGALAAFYHRIPVGHIEAGLRSFNKMHPYPEEINRKLISTLADYHFSPTQISAENLKNEGIEYSKIFVTGNTVIDSLLHVAARKSNSLSCQLPDEAINAKKLILVTAHRRENWGRPLENLCQALLDVVEYYPDIHIVYPVHLNPNVRKTVFGRLNGQERIHLLDPLSYGPFVEVMNTSHLIITDSGGIQEEGPSLCKPVLVFRKVTERPEGPAAGGVRVIGVSRENIVREVFHLLDSRESYEKMTTGHNPYGDGNAAHRIVQAIRHYFLKEDRPEDFTIQEKIKMEVYSE